MSIFAWQHAKVKSTKINPPQQTRASGFVPPSLLDGFLRGVIKAKTFKHTKVYISEFGGPDHNRNAPNSSSWNVAQICLKLWCCSLNCLSWKRLENHELSRMSLHLSSQSQWPRFFFTATGRSLVSSSTPKTAKVRVYAFVHLSSARPLGPHLGNIKRKCFNNICLYLVTFVWKVVLSLSSRVMVLDVIGLGPN